MVTKIQTLPKSVGSFMQPTGAFPKGVSPTPAYGPQLGSSFLPSPSLLSSSGTFGGGYANPTGKLPGLSIAGNSLESWNLPATDTAASGLSSSLSIGGPSTELSGINPDFASGAKTPGMPEMGGKWTAAAGIGLQFGKLGLDVYNALEQSKMNKFMKGYYGDQMDLQQADFTNNAKSVNASLEQREQNKASAAGYALNSSAMKTQVGNYMDKWGVQETV